MLLEKHIDIPCQEHYLIIKCHRIICREETLDGQDNEVNSRKKIG